ncbi:MAG: CDP-glycerol glycerophosphotransferase family protein [Lachnospiraceae bacterium]
MGKMKKYFDARKKKKKNGYYRKKRYVWYLRHTRVNKKLILLESQHGGSLGGNIAAIAKELSGNPLYAEYTVMLSCFESQMSERESFLKEHGMERVRLVSTGRNDYFKALATAKYLVNDNTFLLNFIKRPEQVYLNTWHGTPLKTLGRKIKEECGMIGNAQRNFLMADYLLCPNEFTKKCLVEDYMLSNLGKTKLLLTGYPRNCIFSDRESRESVRKKCGFDGLQVFAYLPTWRGVTSGVNSAKQNEQLLEYFHELDSRLTENQRFYVKLHPISRKYIDLSRFTHILPFPQEYETYEFLNATDGLVTDYSSVFFDYAISGRKIVLFTYDKEEYTSERGFYFPMEELPFPQVSTVDELVGALNAPKEYEDTEFLNTYCCYDRAEVTAALCEKLIFGKNSTLIKEEDLPDNGKKNIVFFAGSLAPNRTTESFFELIKNLDTSRHNYYLLYRMESIKYRQERLHELPDGMNYIGYYSACSLSLLDTRRYELWKKYRFFPYLFAAGPMKRLVCMEQRRLFSGMRIDKVFEMSGIMEVIILVLCEYDMIRGRMKNRKPPGKDLSVKRQVRRIVEEKKEVEITGAAQLEEML